MEEQVRGRNDYLRHIKFQIYVRHLNENNLLVKCEVNGAADIRFRAMKKGWRENKASYDRALKNSKM